jgi:hypothetical protein
MYFPGLTLLKAQNVLAPEMIKISGKPQLPAKSLQSLTNSYVIVFLIA